MERALSQEERIRRAEEIYQRRKMQGGIRVSSTAVNTNNKQEYRMFKKLALQIATCLLIYFSFYLIQNSNYVFSEQVLTKTKEFLSYDINFEEIFNNIDNFYNNNIAGFYKNNEEVESNNNLNGEISNENITNTIDENNNQQNNENENVNVNEEAGIGGGEVSENEQKIESLSQMEIDANEIKTNYNLILPLKGIISSRFGPRTATDIVSANHAGIDIAADEGTIFVASMEGTVTEVLTEGGYGNHVYIQNNDVITLYAHCKTIYVKVGDVVSMGQQIGEIGKTGNATGPHLHFEVRKDNRLVDPEYILEF